MVSWFRRKKPETADIAQTTAPIEAQASAEIPASSAPTDATGMIEQTVVDDYANAAPAATAGKVGWRERLGGSAIARSLGGLFKRNPACAAE